jgi:hypothetical protein
MGSLVDTRTDAMACSLLAIYPDIAGGCDQRSVSTGGEVYDDKLEWKRLVLA